MPGLNINDRVYYICSKDVDCPIHEAAIVEIFDDDNCVELFDRAFGLVAVEGTDVFTAHEAAAAALART